MVSQVVINDSWVTHGPGRIGTFMSLLTLSTPGTELIVEKFGGGIYPLKTPTERDE